MARRRSARLARGGKSPTPEPAARVLSSLTEGDESIYEDAVPSIDAIVSSPTQVPQTPGQSSPIKPPMSEMHPSKAHHGMAAPSSSLRLGFTDIKPISGPTNLPAAIQSTPTKIGFRVPSSDFTFRFARDSTAARDTTATQLGPEVQRLMEEIRNSEDTKRIKEELKAQLEAEKTQADEDANRRKIAKPKGKAGRFSAVHLAEFKKMDSIENHPSAFRVQLGRFAPSTGLKRAQSKANLNDRDIPSSQSKTGLKRTRSKANLQDRDAPSSKGKMPAPKPALQEPQSPTKRARHLLEDDASTARPISRDGSSIPPPKSIASVMTPTKASLARAAASSKTPIGSRIKPPSMLSGFKRSTVTKTPAAGATPVVSTNVTIRSPSTARSASRTFAKMKSMFRGDKTPSDKPKSLLPMMPGSTASLGLDKPLPSLPGATPAKAAKHVVFTPTTQRVLETTQTTPSPLKSGIPKSRLRQPLGEVHYPTVDAVMTADDAAGDVSYPDLSCHENLPTASFSGHGTATVAPDAPGSFTFRSDKTISFGPVSPSGFGASPGQTSVRAVRPSIAPAAAPTFAMPGSFPSSTTVSTTGPDKENEAPAPPSNIPTLTAFRALPHGIINKKRHRVTSDEEEAEQLELERAAKKRRAEKVPEGEALLAPRLTASGRKPAPALTPSARRFATPGSSSVTAASPSPRKKAGMSLTRLNMLARPKNRK